MPTKQKETIMAEITYRFKTRKEFEQQYGDDWVDKINWSPDGGMDSFFGKKITERTFKKILQGSHEITNAYGEWYVDEWMVKKIVKKSEKTTAELHMWESNGGMDFLAGTRISKESYDKLRGGEAMIPETEGWAVGGDSVISKPAGKSTRERDVKLSDKLLKRQRIIKLNQNN